jgi:hypothetical protein
MLRSFSSSDILTIYLRAFLQSLRSFEKDMFTTSRGISARITEYEQEVQMEFQRDIASAFL